MKQRKIHLTSNDLQVKNPGIQIKGQETDNRAAYGSTEYFAPASKITQRRLEAAKTSG